MAVRQPDRTNDLLAAVPHLTIAMWSLALVVRSAYMHGIWEDGKTAEPAASLRSDRQH